MALISLIAAVDLNNGLGSNNQLLCHLPADLKYFKEKTMAKPIIMGRKTYQSIGRPLPGRRNIVISHQLEPVEGLEIVSSIDEAIRLTEDADEVMIIGGGSIYQQSITCADKIYLTIIQNTFNADVFFPEINPAEWNCASETYLSKDENNQFDLIFKIFDRN